METSLTITEEVRLSYLEGVVERGLKTFAEVGGALMEIRDQRLYRQEYGTFEDYCRERWGLERRRAYQLMDAASVASNVNNCTQIPANEGQARPLTKLDPEQQREAWQKAVETAPNGKVTGAHVKSVVDDYLPALGSADTTGDEIEPEESPASRMAVHYSSDKDEWETPRPLFDLLDSEFNFTVDVCALPENAKCSAYFTPEDNGLAQQWRGACWMNPPYGNEIGKWVRKAYRSAMSGATVVCLVPARTDTRWWWNYCIKGEVRFLKGRLKFGNAENSAPFPSAVIIFRPGGGNRRVVWWEEGSNVQL